ncbi:MAG: sigma-70 family RNA polymerase sigma factor [Nitrospirae bacterium]|nr:sigma-70 family RNA polymerase sigma factor [Nitrospirota bacterium]MBI3594437.1 sigma-70 family RNA polymerase sigma factor [Nitrospirota bacterium]
MSKPLNADPEWPLVQSIQDGQVECFEELIKNHEKAVFNFLLRYLGNYHDAEDVAQEVFLAAYRSIFHFRGESRFSTWLFRIAVNRAKNKKKSLILSIQRNRPIDPVENDSSHPPVLQFQNPGPDPEMQQNQKEIQRIVQKEIHLLKPEERAIILLNDFEERSYEEISMILDIPIGTVKSRLHRARMGLKKRLTPYINKHCGEGR